MKKLLKILLATIITLGMFGMPAKFVGAAETPTSTVDLRSQGQGANNWFYCYGSPDKYSLMQYGAQDYIPTAHWYGAEINQYITDVVVNPGMRTGTLLIWVAEFDGEIEITGSVRKCWAGGDGFDVDISIANKSVFKYTFGYNEEEQTLSDATSTVKKGDKVMFYVESGKCFNNGYDGVVYDVNINWLSYTGTKLGKQEIKNSLDNLTDSYIEVLGVNIVKQDNFDGKFTTSYVDPSKEKGSSKGEKILSEYDFKRDFSNKQGYRGWYYLYGDTSGKLYPMTYNETVGMYRGADFWSRISIHDNIPGLNTETVIGFKAPEKCKAKVSVSIFRNPPDGYKSGQDGVWFFGFKNKFGSGDSLLFSEQVVDSEYTLHTFEFTAQVNGGDMLYFALNANNNQNNDNCVISINIKLS